MNGEYPGPTIRVPEGKYLAIKVINKMVEKNTIVHWHGMSQKGSYMYDGTMYLQCPIQPMHSFIYRFKAEPAGVHWYHAHYINQRYDGLIGALIVERSADELRVDYEKKIMENDGSSRTQDFTDFVENSKPIPMIIHEIGHLTSTANTLSNDYYSGFNGAVTVHGTKRLRKHDGQEINAALYDTTAINGRGRNPKYLNLNVITPYEVVAYKSEKLIGLINAGGDYGHEVSVEKHLLRVVECDGMKIKPIEVKFLHIFPGETFTVQLIPINSDIDVEHGEYFFRVETMAELTWGDVDTLLSKPVGMSREEELSWQSRFFKSIPGQEKTDLSAYAIISYSGDRTAEIVSREAPKHSVEKSQKLREISEKKIPPKCVFDVNLTYQQFLNCFIFQHDLTKFVCNADYL